MALEFPWPFVGWLALGELLPRDHGYLHGPWSPFTSPHQSLPNTLSEPFDEQPGWMVIAKLAKSSSRAAIGERQVGNLRLDRRRKSYRLKAQNEIVEKTSKEGDEMEDSTSRPLYWRYFTYFVKWLQN
uniref:Uncharacterized protein n=1 Tax=Solanum tuberosum TaxID=4113 RepID=M1DYW5_SOLTU